MILNMNNPDDIKHFNMLQKGKGIKLISKYLPHLSVHKQLYVVNTIEEWNQIKDKLPETVTIRTDSKNGMPIPQIGGITRLKKDVDEYFERAMKIEEDPYFLCMELEEGTGERIDTLGGLLIDATMGGNVHIGYAGPCFDCRELTKGKAEHETWTIPWKDILFVKGTNHRKWHIQTINQEAYTQTAIERIKFLVHEYPERRYEIIEKMPSKYTLIKSDIIENLINQVMVPLYDRKEELLKDGLEKFDVEVNVLKNGRLVPFEICRPERFIIKKQEREKNDGAR